MGAHTPIRTWHNHARPCPLTVFHSTPRGSRHLHSAPARRGASQRPARTMHTNHKAYTLRSPTLSATPLASQSQVGTVSSLVREPLTSSSWLRSRHAHSTLRSPRSSREPFSPWPRPASLTAGVWHSGRRALGTTVQEPVWDHARSHPISCAHEGTLPRDHARSSDLMRARRNCHRRRRLWAANCHVWCAGSAESPQ
jgi:hypothetical protein